MRSRGSALLALLLLETAFAGCGAGATPSTKTDPPVAPREIRSAHDPARLPEDDLRSIDRALEEAQRSTHPRSTRAKFARRALDELKPLLAAFPEDPELHWLDALGWLALVDERGVGELDAEAARRAHAELDLVDRLAPDGGRAVDVATERGILLSKQSRPAEALAAYQRALEIHAAAGPYASGSDPLEHPMGRAALLYGNAADSLMALGRLDEAITFYQRAREHTPRDADRLVAMPHYALAVALDRDGQPERSRTEMRLALALDPQLAELDDPNIFFVPAGDKHAYVALALLERNRPGDVDAAIAALRRFLGSSPPERYAACAQRHLEVLARPQQSRH